METLMILYIVVDQNEKNSLILSGFEHDYQTPGYELLASTPNVGNAVRNPYSL